MAHHGITKFEIDFCGLQLTQSPFHQQPWPSIGISHTASLSMQHQRKSLAFCVMCIQYRQNRCCHQESLLRYRRIVGAATRRIQGSNPKPYTFTVGVWTGMEEHGLMDSGGNSMDSSVIHASPRQSICVQLSPVNCDPCGSSKLSMKSKEVVMRFHRCPHQSTAIHWQRSMLRHGSPWLPFLCSPYCLTGGQTNSIEGHCNP